MTSKKIYNSLFIALIFLASLNGNALATHISQPILENPQAQYHVGETITLYGWVEYNAQPAPDVLLNFKLTREDGTVAADQSYPSDANGRFEFKFDTRDDKPANYQLIITSHCLEIHRYACTYKTQTLSINLTTP